MPKNSVPISNLTVSIGVIISLAVVVITGYLAKVLQNIDLKFTNKNEKIKQLEKENKELEERHNRLEERVRDLENHVIVIKTEHDKNHKKG